MRLSISTIERNFKDDYALTDADLKSPEFIKTLDPIDTPSFTVKGVMDGIQFTANAVVGINEPERDILAQDDSGRVLTPPGRYLAFIEDAIKKSEPYLAALKAYEES
jgi:hypothetical protein